MNCRVAMVVVVLGLLIGRGGAEPFRVAAALAQTDVSENLLRVVTGAEGAVVAYAGNGVVFGDRVELRFAAGLELGVRSLPEGWKFQVAGVEEEGVPLQVATIYYTGVGAGELADVYDFAEGWLACLTFREPGNEGDPGGDVVPVVVDVFATRVVPQVGVFPVSQRVAVEARLWDGGDAVAFSAVLDDIGGGGATLRFAGVVPGVRYRVERSADLVSWVTAGSLEPGERADGTGFRVAGSGGVGSFFRVVLEASGSGG